MKINNKTLIHALNKMLNKTITHTDYQIKQLQGGTLGDVKLITGTAITDDNENLPYKIVFKTQKKWERYGDLNSWRREYDLYTSDFQDIFNDTFRIPKCYHAEINDNEMSLWLEYVDGISGNALTIDMLELAAVELGRFQGRMLKNPELLQDTSYFNDTGFIERDFNQWKSETAEYRYLISDECAIPKHLCRMLLETHEQSDNIFSDIRKLPVVLCHQDFWIENIFYSDGKIRLIDWDTFGWGYLGEDIACLVIDEIDIRYFNEYFDYFNKLISAYYKGLSEYIDISVIKDFHLRDIIIFKFGFRFVHNYMFTQSNDFKNYHIDILQKIYEIKNP